MSGLATQWCREKVLPKHYDHGGPRTGHMTGCGLGYAGPMGATASSSPQRAPARGRAVAGFYGALALVGFFWHAVGEDSNDIWRLDPQQDALTLLWTPLVGVAAGLVTVQAFRGLELRWQWLGELHREFRPLFGRPQVPELLLLAAASAVGEELLFRGAALDAWGIWASSAVFAALHIPPRRELWPWTASSFVLGLGLAGMTVLCGNLGPAIAAHFVINFLNLAYITRRTPRMMVPTRANNPRRDVPTR